MSLAIKDYTRKPFTVEAVQVTPQNLEEVAKWCGGEIITERRGGREVKYIKVDVSRPMTERQTKAFVEDWVLKAGTGFKCYTKKAFPDCFVEAKMGVTASELMGQEPLFEAPVS